MSIKAALLNWDTKSAEDIEGIYQDFFLPTNSDSETLISSIVDMISLEPLTAEADSEIDILQQGGSWLIKHHLQLGQAIKEECADALLDALTTLRSWQAKLHLLQCLGYFSVKKSQKKSVEHFLRQCLMDKNKFVRAWAYGGFYQLAQQYSEYQLEADNFIQLAMKDEAPSVKARIRNVLKAVK